MQKNPRLRLLAFGVMVLMIPTVVAVGQSNPSEDSAARGSERGESESGNWPGWRGPSANGIADARQEPPATWDEEKNVAWKQPIPGKGHGSVSVFGDRVVVACADLERDLQSVVCLDRRTGKQRWEGIVHRGGLKTRGNRKQNKKASLASTTVALSRSLLFVNFLNAGAVWTTALDWQGQVVWQEKICDYVVHQGYGSSPFLYKGLVIVSADNKGGGAVKAFQQATGETVWKRSRPRKPNYSSPVVVSVAGKDQLILTGCDLVTSLDPVSGQENWEVKGATTECVSTTVTDGQHVFTSGGYPKNHIAAVVADGTGTTVWENSMREYVPSIICFRQHLFVVLDAGIAVCLEASTGREKWKARLSGNFSGSPILVGDVIYATNEAGEAFLFRADTEKYVPVAKNRLPGQVFSTPAICGGQVFLRVAEEQSGNRQEFVYCLTSQD